MCSRFVLRCAKTFAPRSTRLFSVSASAGENGESGYPGAPHAEFTKTLYWRQHEKSFPCFRILDDNGEYVRNDYRPPLSPEKMVAMYETMVRLQVFDSIMYEYQRQGRIPFYMLNAGEEAGQLGTSAALEPDDWIFAQYREAGVLLWRGYTLTDFANQLFANKDDFGKGRQLGVHYGSAKLNFVTISSPLTTQLPQASGAAYALKRADALAGNGPETGRGRCVICYFGEGAASEGDFHPAMNFAATLKCPVVFVCRNNGYAISTGVKDQYAGDGIASRGPGYGIPTIRVDGNDFLAVYEATREARARSLRESQPYLIEAMSYRLGHHSTSDDSLKYRTKEEVSFWSKRAPVLRTRKYLEKQGLWDEQRQQKLEELAREEVMAAANGAEHKQLPPLTEMFTDVYKEIPPHLIEQANELNTHLAQYKSEYTILDRMCAPSEFQEHPRN